MKNYLFPLIFTLVFAGCSLQQRSVEPVSEPLPIMPDTTDISSIVPDTLAVADTVEITSVIPDTVEIIISQPPQREILLASFLGGGPRRFYGRGEITQFTVNRKLYIGGGKTTVRKQTKTWYGAGWTGQPLLVRDGGDIFIIQSCYDHHLRCISADSLKVVWMHQLDDIQKGCGTVYQYSSGDSLDMLVVLQGSRLGLGKSLFEDRIYSMRAIDFDTAEELWRLNITKSHSYSRDNDASPLVLDNAIFNVGENSIGYFLPKNPFDTVTDGQWQTPRIDTTLTLYARRDMKIHGGNLVAEASPSLCGDLIMVTTGAGHVYGIHKESRKICYDLNIGADMDGTPVVNRDNHVLQTVEKQYIKGRGGLIKLDPTKSADQSILWYLPVKDTTFVSWDGGIIGSCAINDEYITEEQPPLFAVIAMDGNLYVGYQNRLSGGTEIGYDGKTQLPTPQLVATISLTSSIATPIFTNANQLVVPTYNGLYFFKITYGDTIKVERRAHVLRGLSIEATPTVWGDCLYVASRNGYFYEIK